MKLIIGLGNPGKKYQHTRHNVGFTAVPELIGQLFSQEAPSQAAGRPEQKFHGELFKLLYNNEHVLFFKPLTFMNESGTAVLEVCKAYKIDVPKDLLVIHDDVDLPLGDIRVSSSSSSAGHKGIQDIINKLGTQNFKRLRIGIESRTQGRIPKTEDYVLQNFSPTEEQTLRQTVLPQVTEEIKKLLETK